MKAKSQKAIFIFAALLAFVAVGMASAKPLNMIEAGAGIAVVQTQAGTVQGYIHNCSELPFVFNNIDLTLTATGGSKEARALATKVSTAWANFAKTGNPNAKGLPKWETYDREKGATMIFDNKSTMGYNHDVELLKLLQN